MTPKEKAKSLFEEFKIKDAAGFQQISNQYVKQCILTSVEDTLDVLYELSDCSSLIVDMRDFYEEVKQEIEKL